MRSLSSNLEATKEIPYGVRQLSDPTLSSQEKSLIKEMLERRGSLKKLLKKRHHHRCIFLEK